MKLNKVFSGELKIRYATPMVIWLLSTHTNRPTAIGCSCRTLKSYEIGSILLRYGRIMKNCADVWINFKKSTQRSAKSE